ALTMRAESAAEAPTCCARLARALAMTSFGTGVTDEEGAVAAGAGVRGLGAGGSPAEVAQADVRIQGTTETKRTERVIGKLLPNLRGKSHSAGPGVATRSGSGKNRAKNCRRQFFPWTICRRNG